jgi:hypothetical protein
MADEQPRGDTGNGAICRRRRSSRRPFARKFAALALLGTALLRPSMADGIKNRRHAYVFSLSISVFIVLWSNSLFGQAYTIEENRFQSTNKQFPSCDLPTSSSDNLRLLEIPGPELSIEIVEHKKIYCIILRKKTSEVQTLLISNYRFKRIYIGDVIENGQQPLHILFSGGFFNQVTIAIVNGKLVVVRP